MLKAAAFVSLVSIIAYAAYALAQVRTDVRPPLSAIASSSSNGVSFAWFYDPAERSVVVCRVGSGPAGELDCRARTTLP